MLFSTKFVNVLLFVLVVIVDLGYLSAKQFLYSNFFGSTTTILLVGFSLLNSNKVPPMLASGLFCTAASIVRTNWIRLYMMMYSAHIHNVDSFYLPEDLHRHSEAPTQNYHFMPILAIHTLSAWWLTNLHRVILYYDTRAIFFIRGR